MKVTKIKKIDAVWCIATTDKGEKHMPIEEAEKLMVKPKKTTKKATKSATKKTDK